MPVAWSGSTIQDTIRRKIGRLRDHLTRVVEEAQAKGGMDQDAAETIEMLQAQVGMGRPQREKTKKGSKLTHVFTPGTRTQVDEYRRLLERQTALAPPSPRSPRGGPGEPHFERMAEEEEALKVTSLSLLCGVARALSLVHPAAPGPGTNGDFRKENGQL